MVIPTLSISNSVYHDALALTGLLQYLAMHGYTAMVVQTCQ